MDQRIAAIIGESAYTGTCSDGDSECFKKGMKSVRPRFPSVTDPQVPGVRGKVRPQVSRVHPRLRPRLQVAC
ncbi:hypothetical protein SKAU_G00095460 [Synaphobranchus kaupii]|uniref:Uncharacterized protein n=1 Tax=Synaphobranchus kaupii TaxID=118154 RepID=A0A9Q1FXD5_SYNKA|nr:hypothetical protein SKAU_G00095460 [Synaphobranchus kaupii]